MTGRTHDLAAFTALTYTIIITHPSPQMTYATFLIAFSANMIGGLAPDIDQPTADLWRRLPAGTVWGKILAPLLGGHRFISHSIIGIIFFGLLIDFLLETTKSFIIADMSIVWWAFMIGYVSHLITDTFTRDGVPWLFPIPIKFGIPPIRALRFKTGGLIEKYIIFPGLMLLNGYLFYTYRSVFLELFRTAIK